jgi:hypothetical protein
MLALLVWLAGCVFGFWLIWHEGYSREAIAFTLCASVMFWMVGGLAWIGQKLKAGGAARTAGQHRDEHLRSVVLTDKDREALKKITESRATGQSSV